MVQQSRVDLPTQTSYTMYHYVNVRYNIALHVLLLANVNFCMCKTLAWVLDLSYGNSMGLAIVGQVVYSVLVRNRRAKVAMEVPSPCRQTLLITGMGIIALLLSLSCCIVGSNIFQTLEGRQRERERESGRGREGEGGEGNEEHV